MNTGHFTYANVKQIRPGSTHYELDLIYVNPTSHLHEKKHHFSSEKGSTSEPVYSPISSAVGLVAALNGALKDVNVDKIPTIEDLVSNAWEVAANK